MKKIIIHATDNESRAAILEGNQLVEFHVEQFAGELVGNIYIGTVVNVLPGMQAAFIDIGIDKNAFLYVNDAIPLTEEESGKKVIPNIKEILHIGKKIIVQVKKEPFGNKGPRVTTHISLPGRYLVYLPEGNYVGISRRITDDEQRNWLKILGESIRKENEGLIIRTLATEVTEKQLERDLNFLRNLWVKTMEQSKTCHIPALIYKDLDLVSRLVRDLLAEDVKQFIIDNGYVFRKIKEMIEYIAPELTERLHFYTDKEHIFDAFNIHKEIDKTLKRKVWLKNGGYIIIDKTEALTAIDVNTGKYIGHIDLEDTVLKTNLEAAEEIAKQLRLRDIGGIIIIDFIDMVKDEHRNKVLAVLEAEMSKDRTKSNILGLTQLGLVELTRKKVRQSIDNVLLKPCPTCDGSGRILLETEVSQKIEREIIAYKNQNLVKELMVEAHSDVLIHLLGKNKENLNSLEWKSEKKIKLVENNSLGFQAYNVQPTYDLSGKKK